MRESAIEQDMTEEFTALAEQIEGSRAPSRLLDCRTWLLVGAQLGHPFSLKGCEPILPAEIVQGRWFGSALDKYPEDVDGVAHSWRVPLFTASRDAAAMLFIDVGHVLWQPVGKTPSCATETEGGWSDYSSGHCAAAAMTAAALRAWPLRATWSHERKLATRRTAT